jgi:hypothetical protein
VNWLAFGASMIGSVAWPATITEGRRRMGQSFSEKEADAKDGS